jgi:adenylate cyclase
MPGVSGPPYGARGETAFMTGPVQTLWAYLSGVVDGPMSAAGSRLRAAMERWPSLGRDGRVDLAAEGLLDDADDPQARGDLLGQLLGAGVAVDELRRAVAQDRLALLPVEAVLEAERTVTLREMAEAADLEPGVLGRRLNALGVGHPDQMHAYNAHGVDAARALKELADAGLPEEALEDLCRVAGRSVGTVAEAIRDVFGEAFLHPGVTERDLGLRYAAAARRMMPAFEPLLRFALTMHLLQLVRSDVVSRAERAAGALPGAREIAVGFIDLSDFTRVGERLTPEEVGALVRRFEAVVVEATPPRVRYVKTIGDAAMLVSPDPAAVVEAALAAVAAGEREDGGLPRVHCGIALGPAVARNGDWLGRPVNVANRLAGCAPPGRVYATDEVRARAGAGFDWEDAGPRRLKGLDEAVRVYAIDPG